MQKYANDSRVSLKRDDAGSEVMGANGGAFPHCIFIVAGILNEAKGGGWLLSKLQEFTQHRFD